MGKGDVRNKFYHEEFEQPELSLSERRRAEKKANCTKKCGKNPGSKRYHIPSSHRFRENSNILRKNSSLYNSSSNNRNDRCLPSVHSFSILEDPSTVERVNSIGMDTNKNNTSKSGNPLKNRV